MLPIRLLPAHAEPRKEPLTVEFHHVQDPWDRMVATAEIKRFDAATPARTRSDKPFWEEFHATFDKRHRKACTKAIRYRDLSKSLALQPPTRGWHEGVYARREQRQSMFRNYCTRADQWRDLHILT